MHRFDIVVAERRTGEEPPSPRSDTFWRVKSVMATLLTASVVVGFLIAALVLGSILAVVLLGAATLALIAAFVKAALRRGPVARQRRARVRPGHIPW